MAQPRTTETPTTPEGPKLPASEVKGTPIGSEDHEESLIDEAVDESFPASDPPAFMSTGSSLAVKKVARDGRDTPPAEPDPGKENVTKTSPDLQPPFNHKPE